VKCDKLSPCSNCRRYGIACVLPPHRPPRWARRTAGGGQPHPQPQYPGKSSKKPDTNQVLARLEKLEKLVKELGGEAQLGQITLETENPREEADQDSDTDHDSDSGHEDVFRYASHASAQVSLPRHTVFLGHGAALAGTSTDHLHPSPAQVPYLVKTFKDNVNILVQTVHMPTVSELLQQTGNGKPAPVRPPAQEALMFAIYFAAVNSLEDSDVRDNIFSKQTTTGRYMCLPTTITGR